MNTLLHVAGLILGFVLLIKGADVFVDSSVNIAKRLRIPNIVIGLTIVSIGTSLPEIVISVSAAISGSGEMAVGNIVGSNIFNLIFVLGFCALIKPIPLTVRLLGRDFWVALGAAVVLLLFKTMFHDVIPRFASLTLFAAYAVYMFILVREALKNRAELNSPEEGTKDEKPLKPLGRSIFFAIIGVGLIVGGGQLTVMTAVELAVTLGITERIIGLTVVAIGTSLPELITSIVACRKGESELAVGNILGTSTFNILGVLGISGVVMPHTIDNNLMFDIVVLIVGSLIFFAFALTRKRLTRVEGSILSLAYTGYIVWIVVFS